MTYINQVDEDFPFYWDALSRMSPNTSGMSFDDYLRYDNLARKLFNKVFQYNSSEELKKEEERR